LAAELVALKIDLIVTNGTPATRAAKQATSAIPIVFLLSDDPVEEGLVESLARPGGNLTGWARGEYEDKHLEVLKEVVGQLARVAVLRDANYGPGSVRWPAAETLGLQVRKFDVRGPNDFEGAFVTARRWNADGLVVDDSPLYGPHVQGLAT
jgi:putative ABC transport system substrate-binding protein